MAMVCKGFTLEEFRKYVEGVKFDGWTPNFITVHNTYNPTQALYQSWHKRKGWTFEQWLRNLASYYAGMGWRCPHVFVAYDRIGVIQPLNTYGTHSPSWNKFSWGVETVGNFDSEAFDGSVKTHLIGVLGILHERLGLNPSDFKLGVRGLHFHKEDKATTHKNCPGKNMIKENLVAGVMNYMTNDGIGDAHIRVSESVHTADTRKLTYTELTSIRWVQEQLKRLRYNVTVNGRLDDETKAAVVKFQMDKSLKNDGVAGPVTRLALKSV